MKKNFWLEEKKEHIKIYDGTKKVSHPSTLADRYMSDGSEPVYFAKVRARGESAATQGLKELLDDHFWFDRIDKQLHEWDEDKRPLIKNWVPTEPGQ